MIEFRDNRKATINSKYKPPEKIKKDRRQVYKRFSDMQNGRVINGENIEAKWDKWERQYEAWRPNKSPDDWQSNITPPFTTSIVERALAEIVDQTMRPKIVARGNEDKAKAQLMNYTTDYTWEIGDGDLELYAGLKQCLILGKTIWQEDYWDDRRKVKVLISSHTPNINITFCTGLTDPDRFISAIGNCIRHHTGNGSMCTHAVSVYYIVKADGLPKGHNLDLYLTRVSTISHISRSTTYSGSKPVRPTQRIELSSTIISCVGCSTDCGEGVESSPLSKVIASPGQLSRHIRQPLHLALFHWNWALISR